MMSRYVGGAFLILALAHGSVAAADADPTIAQIHDAASSGHLDRAQRMMDRVLRDHPESAKAHFVQAELFEREGHLQLARQELDEAERLNPGLSDFKPSSVRELKAKIGWVEAKAAAPVVAKSTAINADSVSAAAVRVPLVGEGGALVVPVLINGAIKLNFTVDSGAPEVSIPADVFSTLLRTATVAKADITGSATNADGGSYESRTFVLRSLKVGELEVANVDAKVVAPNAPLLLGESFLKRFKSWSVDNTAKALILQR
jgi:predicted aspartyl protease